MNQLYDQYFGHTIGHIGFITNNMTNFLSAMHRLHHHQCDVLVSNVGDNVGSASVMLFQRPHKVDKKIE